MFRTTMQSKKPRGRHCAPVPVRAPRRTRVSATVAALTLSLLSLGAGGAAAAERYEVAAGDTLATIAEKFGYRSDDNWRRLYNANPEIDNPDLIVPGQELVIPDRKDRVRNRPLPTVVTPPRRESSAASRSSDVAPAPEPAAPAPATSVWTDLAACESGGDWAANTGNGYYGGLQFSLETWQGLGGAGYPHEASAATQIAMGQRLQAEQGWGAWPGCAAQLGLL